MMANSSSTTAISSSFPASYDLVMNKLISRTYKKLLPLDFLRLHLERNIRPSGRSLLESRQVTLSHINFSSTTFGSVVKIGDTSVVCGISAELAEPTVEKPAEGYIGTHLRGRLFAYFSS
jgi:exosome complex RNA-binding protein Rrp42 (RNase PH superfamily)